jgi:hypothetical protein
MNTIGFAKKPDKITVLISISKDSSAFLNIFPIFFDAQKRTCTFAVEI